MGQYAKSMQILLGKNIQNKIEVNQNKDNLMVFV